MTVSLWRIASDTTSWTAEDMAGKGAARSGARWNQVGEHVTYASTSISLAAWETRAHFAQGIALPWNRILVRIDVPDDIWAARAITPGPLPVGWDVVPEGMVSRAIGSAWLASGATALLVVPSVIINEEDNVLINPAHPDATRLTVDRVRRFVYDQRV
ncbi:RES family NAD+ phosphorylase [Rugamonas rivuli]|uniref:RES domain-containing protein n=1 Tax=Rugamonas rivuli TaxID=2743358 RepID=A0A843SCF4_9BURK|nr:RES family NAD+ phosphorylase [Rugamonas rivuli]MQA22215.1 RES domain-containing protein [Rugamonas rivuli]